MRFNEFTQNINEAPLTNTLYKYLDKKKDIILRKIKDSDPFTVKIKNKTFDVVIDPSEYGKAQQWLTHGREAGVKFKTVDGMTINAGSIVKTKELGGEEAGKREKIEQRQIASIAADLEKAKNGKSSIQLTVGDRVVQAARVEKEQGLVNGKAPKSDMTVIDEQGKAVAWVSLKGLHARWGGWTHLLQDENIKNWIARIKQETGNILNPKQSYGLHTNDEVKQKIVYGKKFGKTNNVENSRGISNVDCVLIGSTSIKKEGENFVLSANTVYTNGEIPTGDNDPYLVLRYTSGRTDAGFMNARAETNRKGEGRKVKWLDADVPADKTTDAEQPGETEVEQPDIKVPQTEPDPNLELPQPDPTVAEPDPNLELPQPDPQVEPADDNKEIQRLKTLAGNNKIAKQR